MDNSSCKLVTMKLNEQTKQRAIIIVVLLVSVLFVFAMYSRISKLNNFREEARQSTQILAYYQETESVLKTSVAVIESNQIVDEWARVEGRYVHYGDVPIVIITPYHNSINMNETPLPPKIEFTNLEAWQVWLFGFKK